MIRSRSTEKEIPMAKQKAETTPDNSAAKAKALDLALSTIEKQLEKVPS